MTGTDIATIGRPLTRASTFKRHGYTWVTAGLFAVSLAGHWWLG